MLYNEGVAALYQADGAHKTIVSNYIYGLGGRDLKQSDIIEVFQTLNKDAQSGKRSVPTQQFIGLRGAQIGFF